MKFLILLFLNFLYLKCYNQLIDFYGNLHNTVWHSSAARCVISSSIYSETAVGYHNGEIRIFENNGTYLRSFITERGFGVNSITYLENGDLAVTGFFGTRLYSNTGSLKQVLSLNHGNAVVFLNNGNIAFNTLHDIYIFDTVSNVLKLKLSGHKSVIYALLVLPNGDLVSGSDDNSIKIWDINNGTLKQTLTEKYGSTRSLILLGNSQIAAASDFGQIGIWNIETNIEEKKIKTGHNGLLLSIVLLPNGKIASSSTDHDIKIWNIENGLLVQTLTNVHDDWIMQLNVNSDNYLVSASYDGSVKFWN